MKRLILFCLLLAVAAVAQAQYPTTGCYRTDTGITCTSGSTLTMSDGSILTLADGVTFTLAETLSVTLGADEYLLVDGATTAQTQTAGAIDLNFASITANANGLNLAATMNNGTASGTDVFGSIWTLTNNDADGDLFGLKLVAAASANAAAGSYEYLIGLDCAENTAGACPDALLITSTGVNAGVTDAIDVSASNITNGINLGDNILLMAAGNVDADTLAIDSTDDMTITVTSGSAGEDLTIQQAGANDSSIIISAAGTGADALSLQATAGTVDIDGNLITVDSTNDMVIQVTSSGAGEDLYIAQVGGNDSSVLISAAGTGTDAIQLLASAGAVDIQASTDVTITPGDDLDLMGNEGAAAAAGNVASERCMGGFCQTVMTLTDVAVNIANTSGPGHNCFGGVKVYDFPAGWVNRLGVVATFTSITFGAGGLADNSDGDVGFGSTTAVEDGGLAGTEVDWVPSTELTTAVGGVVPAELATSTVAEQTLCDGSGAACGLYMNFEFDDADCSAADTLAVTGTVTVTWIALGDN